MRGVLTASNFMRARGVAALTASTPPKTPTENGSAHVVMSTGYAAMRERPALKAPD